MPFTGTESITIERYAKGTYTNGVYSQGSKTEITTTASVQPLNGKELQRIPENRRERATRKIYTRTEIKNEDIIIIDSEDYEVYQIEDFSRHPFLQHWKALIIRKNYEGQR